MDKLKVLRQDKLNDKVCIVVGTRPGIIKFSPIIRELKNRGKDFFIIHTGQHYSYEMDKIFFDELELPEPKYKLKNVKKEKYHGGQTAKMLVGLENALLKEKPKVIVVGGDANTNLAGALAGRKIQISVCHMEAGLRSNDWRMPEEHNRIMIDHISDYLFPPTKKAKKNLEDDGVKGKIYVTGNSIVDAVKQNLDIAKEKSEIIKELNIKTKKYFLLTIHREETVDYKENFVNVLRGIKLISNKYKQKIIFPAHPRTLDRIKSLNLNKEIEEINNLEIITPPGYLDFLILMKNSKLVLTDSGGIQEESCILKIPCVTLRDNTERPETVDVGGNYIAGNNPKNILEGVEKMLRSDIDWSNPFGKNPAKKIIDIVERI